MPREYFTCLVGVKFTCKHLDFTQCEIIVVDIYLDKLHLRPAVDRNQNHIIANTRAIQLGVVSGAKWSTGVIVGNVKPHRVSRREPLYRHASQTASVFCQQTCVVVFSYINDDAAQNFAN